MANLRLGIVGAGFVANFHARALRQVRGVEIAGIVALRGAEELSATVQAQRLGEAKVYPSISAMAPHVDAIAVYAPNFARLEIVEEIAAAAQLGARLKGVICEKPLGRNVREARRLVELAEQAGLKTAYFENQIFMKPMQAQLAQLAPQQRTMGPLALTRAAEEHGGPHEAWFWDPTRQGGGVLCDMGCHSIAAGWYALTPAGKPVDFLQPVAIWAETALLKWGLPQWRAKLLAERGVDYSQTPAEDYSTGLVTFRNPESGQLVKTQFTVSWMFEKQGLRLFMDGMGPGYAFEINTLQSSLQIFIGDVAAEATANAETALEKATASRGLLAVQYNEADLYGYSDENEQAVQAFNAGQDGLLTWRYGLEITKLVMAAYLSAERRQEIDLTDPAQQQFLETYVPLIQQGRGADVLFK
jgi:predicted dehydrogenase